MTITSVVCDLCRLAIPRPNDGNTIGFGITSGIRSVAPISQTTSAGVQACGDCTKFIVGVWKNRQVAIIETPPAATT